MGKIPVTIITGFLGAGKTTLLNQIIAQNEGLRFAIIENEFGEINIDSELVIGADAGIFELSNGCICCTSNGELAETLAKLVVRESDFDHLIIETTGIANPAAVAAAFLTDYEVQERFELNATLCVVDALHVEQELANTKEAAQQIAYADVLVLNKINDTVDTDHLRSLLKKINPFAQLILPEAIAPTLLQVKAFAFKTVEQQYSLFAHKDYQHGQITSQSYTFKQDFDFLKFRHFMQVLLMFQGMRIYRVKGILAFQGDSQKVIFQSVQEQMVFKKGSDWGTELRESRLVVIGNGLDKLRFEKKLRECLS